MATPVGLLAIDAGGTAESVIASYSFVNNLPAGDSILASPVPVITQVAVPSTAPTLTFTSVTVLTASIVQARVTVTNGVAGTLYETVCRVTTTQGNVLECFLNIRIIGPSAL